MTVYEYHRVYEELRTRIQAGEFALGERLPSIQELQNVYGVTSLNTVRSAQQLLVAEGLIRTEQGRGAFVISTESAQEIDPLQALDAAAAEITRARKALTGAAERVTIDFGDDAVYFVVLEALREFASQQRHQAEAIEPDQEADTGRLHWARVADEVIEDIESSLDRQTRDRSSIRT